MIPDLDFLPPSYHKKRLQRQKKSWRGSILIAFCVLVTIGSIQLHARKSSLQNERDRLQLQTQQLNAQLRTGVTVQQQIQLIDQQLDLLGLLKARVPVTRLLSEITGSLPEYVSLTALRMNVEKIPQQKSAASLTPRKLRQPTRKKKDEDEQSPLEQDLEHLGRQRSQEALYILVEGIAPDDVAISTSLQKLRQCGYFPEVTLIYTDTYLHGDAMLRTFSMKLRVRRIIDNPNVTMREMSNAIRMTGSFMEGYQ